MIIYVTRHGQPAIGELPPGVDHEFPPGDPTLTELGLKQAAFLGEFLKSNSFKGRIYSSPYRRTLYTALEVAKATGTDIFPERAIQEYVTKDGVPNIDTLTLPEIKKLFPHISPKSALEDSWLFSGPETEHDVRARVKPFLDALIESTLNPASSKTEIVDEALLVGHGASVGALKILLFELGGIPYVDNYNWNCSLSKFVIENGKTISVDMNCDFSFIPEEFITSNKMKYPGDISE
jgi:broad specificity phosphatase PhoE